MIHHYFELEKNRITSPLMLNVLTKEQKVTNFLTHQLLQAALPKQDLKPDLPESLFNDLYQVHSTKYY